MRESCVSCCFFCLQTVLRTTIRVSQRARTSLLMLIVPLLILASPVYSQDARPASDVRIRVSAGGTGRFAANRWGLAEANVMNYSDDPASAMIIVTPPEGQGLQYARKVEVPAHMAFEAAWPFRIANSSGGGQDFPYLIFPNGEEDGILRQTKNSELLPSFTSPVLGNGPGYTGWISDSNISATNHRAIDGLIRALRIGNVDGAGILTVLPNELTSSSESLDMLDQLIISSPLLLNYPQACEAIRVWMQRGGRMMLVLEQTGPELAKILLGECFPMDVVGEASANSVTLDLNPQYRQDQYPVRNVIRTFDEPVRYLRVAQDAGEVIWSVDGWPVASLVHVGRGAAVVTTISSQVFIEEQPASSATAPPFRVIASSRRMAESIFVARTAPLVDESTANAVGATMTGYAIPSRKAAVLLSLLFPVLLAIAGLVLQRKHAGQRLIWVVPVLAILASIPSLVFGRMVRAVAPPTVVETSIVQAIPGMLEQTADGFTTIYVPSPSLLSVDAKNGTIFDAAMDAANRDYRRLIWSDGKDSHWQNLNQPNGIRTYPLRSTRRFPSVVRAIASFNEQGLSGTLASEGIQNPADLLLAGVSPDRMSVTLNADGSFIGTPDDVLAPNQFFNKAMLVTDEQRHRSTVLKDVFENSNSATAFPNALTLMFWEASENLQVNIAGDDLRRRNNTLFLQPVSLQPPVAGAMVTIPSPLISYRSVPGLSGGQGSAYSNPQRVWQEQEGAVDSLLEFLIPSVCTPFDIESAELAILIRAGSRVLTVSAGDKSNLQLVSTLQSPLGTFNIELPRDLIKNTGRTGSVFVSLKVSDLDAALQSDGLSGEQDDYWKIEYVRLTLKGRRQADVVAQTVE